MDAQPRPRVKIAQFIVVLSSILGFLASVREYGLNPKTVIWGVILTIFAIGLLLILNKTANHKTFPFHTLGSVLLWTFVLLFCSTLILLFTSVFFAFPRNLTSWIDAETQNSIQQPETHIQQDSVTKQPSENTRFLKEREKVLPQIKTMVEVPIQLAESSGGLQSAELNGKPITPNASSTTFNPRFTISKNDLSNSLLKIITKNNDTCQLNLTGFDPSQSLRLIPNCN